MADKPVILIGGSAGAGKSTLAAALSWRLDIDHRISTGIIREIVKSESNAENDGVLFGYSFDGDDPVAQTLAQSRRLFNAITACIERTIREGTSLVIEGTHLVPAMYGGLVGTSYVVLAAPDELHHRQQLQGPTHARRPISEEAFRKIRTVDAYYRKQASESGALLLEHTSTDELVRQLEDRLHLPRGRPVGA